MLLNSGDNVKFKQTENGWLSLHCFLRFMLKGEGLLFGSFLLVITLQEMNHSVYEDFSIFW